MSRRVAPTAWPPPATWIIVAALLGTVQACDRQGGELEEVAVGPLVPEIVGDWWQIAGNPDLGEFTSPGQEPTAFGIWQAADGSWQLWGCIRKTNVGGNTRLFYRWEGARITDVDWQPVGIAMMAGRALGRGSRRLLPVPNALQA